MADTPWYKQKTTWAGLAAILTAVGGYFMGDITLVPAIQTFFGGLIAIFLRQAVNK
jgi:hypothetical protein